MAVLVCLVVAYLSVVCHGYDTATIINPAFEGLALESSEGQWTEWFDFDPITRFSLGEFEGTLAINIQERRQKKCLLPCSTYAQYEIRFKESLNGVSGQYVVESCLAYQNPDVLRTEGFVCVNAQQKTDYISYWPAHSGFGHCDVSAISNHWNDTDCSLALPPTCSCPDVEVRYFCFGTPEELQEYCDRRTEEVGGIVDRSKRSVRDTYTGLKDHLAIERESFKHYMRK